MFKHRGELSRLGFAVRLGTVRFLGAFLTAPLVVPWNVVDYFAVQLGCGLETKWYGDLQNQLPRRYRNVSTITVRCEGDDHVDVGRWEKAVDAYLLPTLGDGWRAAEGRLVRGAVGWTAQTVQPLPPLRRRPNFQVEVIVWLLAVPMADSYTCSRRLDGVFPEPGTLAGYEPVMADIRDVVLREGVPFLDRYGDVEGFLAHRLEWEARDAERGLTDPNMRASEELAYLHVIRGDWDAALAAAALTEEAGELNRSDPHPIPWEDEILERVRAVIALGPDRAREALARNAAATATALSLSHYMGCW